MSAHSQEDNKNDGFEDGHSQMTYESGYWARRLNQDKQPGDNRSVIFRPRRGTVCQLTLRVIAVRLFYGLYGNKADLTRKAEPINRKQRGMLAPVSQSSCRLTIIVLSMYRLVKPSDVGELSPRTGIGMFRRLGRPSRRLAEPRAAKQGLVSWAGPGYLCRGRRSS